MSDEPPPPLRLKPRLPAEAADRASGSSAPKPPPETPVPEAETGGTGAAKLRLKPRLAPDEPAVSPGAESTSGPATESAAPEKTTAAEAPSTGPVAPAGEETPRPKLGLKPPPPAAGVPHPPVVLPAESEAAPTGADPAEDLAGRAGEPGAGAPLPHLRAPAGLQEPEPAAEGPRRRYRLQIVRRRWAILLGAIIVAAGAAGFYFVVPLFREPLQAAPAQRAAMPRPSLNTPAPVSGATSRANPPVAAEPQTVLGQAVRRAQDEAAAQAAPMQELEEALGSTPSARSGEAARAGASSAAPSPVAPTDEVAADASAPTRAAENGESVAPGMTASPIAPGVTAITSTISASSGASAAFRSYVANVRISGVFQGAPPRALIDGRTVRAGEVVNAALGITFERVDAPRKLIVFRDRSGATVMRRY